MPARPEERIESEKFPRWFLPAATGVALAIGALWWSVTLHQEAKPLVQLRDGERVLSVNEKGDAAEFRDLPPPLHEAVMEALRTGHVKLSPNSAAARGESEALAGNSPLIRGVIQARAGLRVEAAREFATLVRQNPQSPMLRRLLDEMALQPNTSPPPIEQER